MNLIELAEHLETYDFQCEGGPLKNCVDWQKIKAALGAQPPADSPPPEVVKLRNQGDNAAMYADGLQQQAAPTRSTPAPQKAKRWNIACPMDGRHAVMSSPCSWCDGTGFVSIYLANEIDAPPAEPFDPDLLNALKLLADNACTDRNDPERVCDEMLDYPKAKWCAVCLATHTIDELYRLRTSAAVPPGAADVRKLAEAIVDDLFVNGGGERADRLVLMVDAPTQRDLGGWGKEAMVDRIEDMFADLGVAPAGPRDEKEQK